MCRPVRRSHVGARGPDRRYRCLGRGAAKLPVIGPHGRRTRRGVDRKRRNGSGMESVMRGFFQAFGGFANRGQFYRGAGASSTESRLTVAGGVPSPMVSYDLSDDATRTARNLTKGCARRPQVSRCSRRGLGRGMRSQFVKFRPDGCYAVPCRK